VCVFIVFAAEASAGVYAGVRKDYVSFNIADAVTFAENIFLLLLNS